VATGSGGPSGLEDSPCQPSRAKKGSARGGPRTRAFSAVLRRASQLETTATIPSGIQRASPREVTDITPRRNQGSQITPSTNPRQPCPISPHRGASPREVTDITPSRNQGSQIPPSTNPRQPCCIRAPTGARAIGKQQTLSQADLGLQNFCYHESMQPRRIPPQGGASPREMKTLPQAGTRSTKYCCHESMQPCCIPAPQRREPSQSIDTRLRWTQGPRIMPTLIHAAMLHPYPEVA